MSHRRQKRLLRGNVRRALDPVSAPYHARVRLIDRHVGGFDDFGSLFDFSANERVEFLRSVADRLQTEISRVVNAVNETPERSLRVS